MPNYAWTCFACDSANPAGSEICGRCGFAAQADGRDIVAARKRFAGVASDTPAPQPHAKANASPEEPRPFVALIVIASGVVCLFGAVQSFVTGKWPAYMPPQLDVFALPLSMLSERLGAAVGGVLSAIVGIFCVVGGLLSARGRDAV